MKKTMPLFALLCLATFATAQKQKQAVGLRLAYFTGTYKFADEQGAEAPTWIEQPEGVEAGVFYRMFLGHSPMYLQTELSFFSSRIEGIVPWFRPYDHLIDLKGQQGILQIPLIAGGQFGRGRLHGFLAAGVSYGIFVQKNWQRARYFGADGRVLISGGEFGFLGEAGINYDLIKRLQLALSYRYLSTQHHLSVESISGSASDSWQTKRGMPQLSLGWKF